MISFTFLNLYYLFFLFGKIKEREEKCFVHNKKETEKGRRKKKRKKKDEGCDSP